MGKHTIINLKKSGHSNRGIEKMTGINRKTIAKYWNEYLQQSELLNDPTEDIPEIQEAIVATPKYDLSNRGARKYSNEMDKRLDQILNLENRKTRLLGPHKQNLTRF